jgi:PQQ-dependent catabolism-associated CXXCW motif protein
MPKARMFAGRLIALVGLVGQAQAQQTTVASYTCNIEGAPAQLTAQVQVVRPAGVFMGSDGKFGGAIDTGEVNYYYQGTLTSATSRYTFTGENQYADFVDLATNDRFRVQFIVQGQQMLMIVNPFGPGPVQYLCQQAGGSATQTGGNQMMPGGLLNQGPQAPGTATTGVDLDQLMRAERQDLGVQPTKQLHDGAMHGPTPASIPGGQVVTTKGLVELVQRRPMPFVVFDVLGGAETLPGAVPAAWVSQSGSLKDQIQLAVVQLLQQQTGGNKQMPLVFYCLSRECWLSYNAALRAIAAGYTNVLWYRGGIEAWKMAGLPTQPVQPGSASR